MADYSALRGIGVSGYSGYSGFSGDNPGSSGYSGYSGTIAGITAEPGSDHEASGIKITLTAAVDVSFGDVGYINSNGKVALADADSSTTASAIVLCADSSISADASGNWLLFGIARDDTWTWTVGGLIFLSTTGTTGNTLTQTKPTGTGDVVQVLGVATHADRMFFSSNLAQIVLV